MINKKEWEQDWCYSNYTKGSIKSFIWVNYKIKGKEAQRYIQWDFSKCLGHFWSYRRIFIGILVRLETIHLNLFIHLSYAQ
jgi:hypothetical protein